MKYGSKRRDQRQTKKIKQTALKLAFSKGAISVLSLKQRRVFSFTASSLWLFGTVIEYTGWYSAAELIHQKAKDI